nr:type II toxin-antitoxin system RelE/ParE family toxin [Escherichia coli]
MWFCSYHHLDKVLADKYINTLPLEGYIIYFLQPYTHIIVRILSPHQDAGRYVN